MAVMQPKFQVKLNTEYEDLLHYEEVDENKLFLSQFDDDSERVYISLNGTMVHMKIDELKSVVDMLSGHVERVTVRTFGV